MKKTKKGQILVKQLCLQHLPCPEALCGSRGSKDDKEMESACPRKNIKSKNTSSNYLPQSLTKAKDKVN